MLEVVGPNLTLTPVAPVHVPELLALGSDPEVTRWFSWGPYTDAEQPRRWVAESQAAAKAGTRLALAILGNGELRGMTELAELSVRDRRAMVGTWLGRESWGTHVNAESKALVLHLAFAVLGLERVGAYTNVANVRSQRALEKLGFRREGELRRWHRHGDEQFDLYLYGILAGEWTPLPGVEVRGTPPAAWVMRGATPS